MNSLFRMVLCMAMLLVLAFISCEKVPDATVRTVPSIPSSIINAPPVANAGDDQVIYIPTLSTKLDGTKSTDPNNDIRTYQWKQIAGNTAYMYNVVALDSKEIGVGFPSDGVYRFELTVTDVANLVSRDTVQVTVIDNFAPGVAPVFVDGCDTLVLADPENSTYVWSRAAVSQGGETYWLTGGYTYKQLSGPTVANIVYPNGPGSSGVTVQGLAKGIYAFGIEVERRGLKAYDTSIVRVINDTVSGKEYIFESSWSPSPWGEDEVIASTASRPEIFFSRNGVMKKYKVWVKVDNASDWMEIPLVHWMDAGDYYVWTDECSHFMNVSYWGADYKNYTGKKVLIKVHVP